jgi:flagellin
MNIVNAEMSKVGALTGRMTFKEDQISASQINTEAAYNRIMNANMAEEQVNASKFQILQQTATAMLAQANAAPQFLLSLFR